MCSVPVIVHVCRSTNVIMKPALDLAATGLAAVPRKTLLHVIDRVVVENLESSGRSVVYRG